MKLTNFAGLFAVALGLAVATPAAAADDWPNKPITLIVSFEAGGNADLQGRIEAKYWKRSWAFRSRSKMFRVADMSQLS